MAYWAFGLAHEGGVDALLEKWNPESDNDGSLEVQGFSSSQVASSSSKLASEDSKSSPSIGIAEDERSNDTNGASTSDQANASLTLEQLLEEDDLLQECKNGNAKLVSKALYNFPVVVYKERMLIVNDYTPARVICRTAVMLVLPARLSVHAVYYQTDIGLRLRRSIRRATYSSPTAVDNVDLE